MRKVTCTREGCVIGPKMGKETQVGAGVLRLGQSYLVPFSHDIPCVKSLVVKKRKSKGKLQKGRGVVQNIESHLVSFKPQTPFKSKKQKVVTSRVSKVNRTQKGKGASKSKKKPIVISSLELTGTKRHCVHPKPKTAKSTKKALLKHTK